jgi:hypothetical protein
LIRCFYSARPVSHPGWCCRDPKTDPLFVAAALFPPLSLPMEDWCLLSAEVQLHAGRSPQFANPFAALYRMQRKANRTTGRVNRHQERRCLACGRPVRRNCRQSDDRHPRYRPSARRRRARRSAATAGRSLRLLLASLFVTGTANPPKRKARTRHAL